MEEHMLTLRYQIPCDQYRHLAASMARHVTVSWFKGDAADDESAAGNEAVNICSGIQNMKEMCENKQQSKKLSPQVYTVLASVIASLGGIFFGYDIGIISGALLQLRKEFNLDSFQQEIIVCSMLAGSFCSSFIGGTIIDQFGRKNGIISSSILFIAGTLVVTLSLNYYMIVAGRFILGFAVSVSITAECTYISEIAPQDIRGMLVTLNEVGTTVGFLLAYLLNYLFISDHQGWKYMFGFGLLPAVLQVIGISFMPQSPYFLLVKGKINEAENVLKLIRTSHSPSEEIKAIQAQLKEEKSTRFVDLLSSTNNMRGRLLLGMVLVICQQFSGHANVLYYAPTLFQSFSFCSDSSATLVTVGLGVVKVLATILTTFTVDRFGRRRLLLVGCFLMATSITVLGIVAMNTNFDNICNNESMKLNKSLPLGGAGEASAEKIPFDIRNATTRESSPLLEEKEANQNGFPFPPLNTGQFSSNKTFDAVEQEKQHSVQNRNSLTLKVISVFSLMTFVCAYGVSYGPVTWLILSEIFPTSLRGRAFSVASSMNWGSNLVVSLSFLNLLDAVGTGVTFVMYGGLSVAAFFIIFLFVPETKHKSLEIISSELSKGFLQCTTKSCRLC